MRNRVGPVVLGDDFFERPRLVKKIWHVLDNGNNILLRGPHKCGKTSLLLHLRDNPKDDISVIYVDASLMFKEDDFYEACLKAIYHTFDENAGEIKSRVQALLDAAKKNHYRLLFFGAILRYKQKTGRLLIIVDELSTFISRLHAENTSDCYSMLFGMQDYRQDLEFSHVHFILAGSPYLDQLMKELNYSERISDLTSIDIMPLPQGEAANLVQLLLSRVDFQMAIETIDYCLQRIQWLNPFHIQLLFQKLTDIAFDEDLTVIGKTAIDNAFLKSQDNGPVIDYCNLPTKSSKTYRKDSFNSALFRLLSTEVEIELDKISELAKEHKVESEYKGILKFLVQDGYITNKDTPHLYRFNSGFIKAHWGVQVGGEDARGVLNEFKKVKVNALKIQNIKCFDDITIDFNASNAMSLITGSNARGKTTILQLLALGLCGVKNVPFVYNWKQVVKSGCELGQFDLEIIADGAPVTLSFEIDSNDSITCTQGDAVLAGLQDKFLMIAYGANRHIKLEDPRPNKEVESIATLFGENGYLKHIKVSVNYEYVDKNFSRIVKLINAVLEKADLEKKVTLSRYDASSLYFETSTSPEIPIEALSEGFKSTFVWLFDMILRIVEKGGDLSNAQDITGVVLLDEVDLHLHPSWQRTILPSLNALFPNIQFIVSSHSPFVAQSLKNEQLISLEWADDKVVVVQKDMRAERSYNAVVRDIFGIQSPFSHETSQKINRFREMQESIRKEKTIDEDDFKALVIDIAERGPELEGVMRREIQSLERRIGRSFDLWIK